MPVATTASYSGATTGGANLAADQPTMVMPVADRNFVGLQQQHGTHAGSIYSVAEVPAEERMIRKPALSFRTRDLALASVLLVMRWLVSVLVFISVILNWVSRFDYENVVLGIISLGMVALLMLSDVPGLWDHVRFVRTTALGFTRTYFRMSIFLAFLAITVARQYGTGLITAPGIVIANTTYSIVVAAVVGFVSLVHFVAWAAFFRRHGNPDVHEVGSLYKRFNVAAMQQGTALGAAPAAPVTLGQNAAVLNEPLPAERAANASGADTGAGTMEYSTVAVENPGNITSPTPGGGERV